MSEECKNADTKEGKNLIQEKDVFKKIADLLAKEGLISIDEKRRFLSALKENVK